MPAAASRVPALRSALSGPARKPLSRLAHHPDAVTQSAGNLEQGAFRAARARSAGRHGRAARSSAIPRRSGASSSITPPTTARMSAAPGAESGSRQRIAHRRGRGVALQRRALAPLFSPREVADFAAAMQRVAARVGVERLVAAQGWRVRRRRPHGAADARSAGADTFLARAWARAERVSARGDPVFQQFGRLDPLDLSGAPEFLPRIGRLRGRSALEFFAARSTPSSPRRRRCWNGAPAPARSFDAAAAARDPETGAADPRADIRANIVTFIGAGHETTANG